MKFLHCIRDEVNFEITNYILIHISIPVIVVAPNNAGPVEYLMTGHLPDVSARSFLHSNIDYDCRKKWDVVRCYTAYANTIINIL